MKATDLMIGDIILFQGDGKHYRISEIDKANVLLETDNYMSVSLNHIQPIPLTPEILERNWFKRGYKSKYSDEFEDEDMILIHFPLFWCNGRLWTSTGDDFYLLCKCEYIHELQHALKLCGIEKEITL